MMRKIILTATAAFAAGILFVNIYNSLVDAPNWGGNFPSSIQTARDYFAVANPGNFYRIFSPVNQVLALLSLIFCWKINRKARLFCMIAFLCAAGGDILTFAYFYPRNNSMFGLPVNENLDAIKTAWAQWSSMNWIRSLIVAAELLCIDAALWIVFRYHKEL